MVGNRRPASCARVGIRTVKTRSFIYSQSDRQRIRFQQLPGMLCGEIVTATKARVISLRSVCLCSCTSMPTRGSTIVTGAKLEVTALTIFKTQLRQLSLIGRSALTCRTTSLVLDQTSGVSPRPTVQKVILRGVV